MTREILWTWAAEADMQCLYAESEDVEEGRGLKLLTQVEKATMLLLHFPRMAPQWRSTVRRLVLKKLHSGLFYVPEPQRVVIIAVADLRTDPDMLWRDIRNRIP
jgi:plasmid stabilization system protein ParE